MKKNIKVLSQSKSDDEWYTPYESAEDLCRYALLLAPKNIIVWAPFDNENSNIVKVLKEWGYQVVYSHLSEGKDFYQYEPEKWDIIISNPPFKNKRIMLQRMLSFKKPFYLLMGTSMFMQNGLASTLNHLHFYFLPVPLIYFNNKDESKKFLSCIVSRSMTRLWE